MNLSPEDRDIGKENFQAAVGAKATRAKLMEETVAKKLASRRGLGARYFGYGAEVDRPVRIGVIGTGDEGSVLIGALNPKYVQVVAIADIRPFNVYRAFNGDKSSEKILLVRPGLMKIYGWPDEKTAREQVKVYTNRYEELLDDPNVEAVIIALPLHLHAVASIKAMRKGKPVLCEKLMAHSVHECKEVARVAKETGKLMVVGHQRHYSVLYDNAVNLIQRGLIGEIHHIRAQWHRLNDTWKPPMPDKHMKGQLAVATKALAEAHTELSAKENGLPEAWNTARKKLKKDQAESVEKLDSTIAESSAAIREQQQKIAGIKGSAPDDANRRTLLAASISAQKVRLAEKTRELGRLLDPKLQMEIDKLTHRVETAATQHEILTHKLEDAQLAVKVKDYGYRDATVGDKKITALEELIRWRLWNRTGGGLMAELGSHQLDAAGIFISALRKDGEHVHPLSVAAFGGRSLFEHDRDIDDHVYCTFEYPGPKYDPQKAPEKKIVVCYSSINGNGFGDYGETVLGTKGTLLLETEEVAMLYQGWATSEYAKVRKSGDALELVKGERDSDDAELGRHGLGEPFSKGYAEEIEHWAWSIRNPDKEPRPRCGPTVALADAVIALTTNIAIAERRRIEFKPAWFDPESDETPEGEKPDVSRKEYAV